MRLSLLNHKHHLIMGAVALLLLVELVMQVRLAITDSQTTDEAVHLSAGYTYITRGDWRFNPEHPPLLKLISGLAVTAIHPHEPSDTALWDRSANFFYDNWRENRQFGADFLYNSGNNASALLLVARLPVIAVTLLLGLIVFLISRSLFGDTAGLLSLTLYAFDPTVIAHGHLVTTDIAVTFGFLSTLWLLWRYVTKPRWKELVMLAISLALTLLFKFTAIILLPIIAAMLLWMLLVPHKHISSRLTLLSHLIVGAFVVWGIIIVAYGFDTHSAPASPSITHAIVATVDPQFAHLADTVQASKLDRVYSALHPFLIPQYFFKGLVMILTHVSNGHDAFFLGKISKTGWWYYFPILLLAKIPVSTLLVFVLAGVVFVRKKTRGFALFLVASAVAFLAMAMLSKANLGIRHVLPILPILYIACGSLMKGSRRIRMVGGALAILSVIMVAAAFPFELGYFNQLFGGSHNGVNVATDSNLDWGQDLKRIKTYVDTHSVDDAMIIYPWDSDSALGYYHIQLVSYRHITQYESATIIIGATFLHDPEYEWLLAYEPTAYISPGVFVYSLGHHL